MPEHAAHNEQDKDCYNLMTKETHVTLFFLVADELLIGNLAVMIHIEVLHHLVGFAIAFQYLPINADGHLNHRLAS